MNTTDLLMLTYCITHLVKTAQENQSGGMITLALVACLVGAAAVWKSSGR